MRAVVVGVISDNDCSSPSLTNAWLMVFVYDLKIDINESMSRFSFQILSFP